VCACEEIGSIAPLASKRKLESTGGTFRRGEDEMRFPGRSTVGSRSRSSATLIMCVYCKGVPTCDHERDACAARRNGRCSTCGLTPGYARSQ
jgi:hypothetical protein